VAACGAAAGLAAAGQLGEAQLSEVVKDMLGLVKRPRWVLAAFMCAFGKQQVALLWGCSLAAYHAHLQEAHELVDRIHLDM
jgi:hypothetical protein